MPEIAEVKLAGPVIVTVALEILYAARLTDSGLGLYRVIYSSLALPAVPIWISNITIESAIIFACAGTTSARQQATANRQPGNRQFGQAGVR